MDHTTKEYPYVLMQKYTYAGSIPLGMFYHIV